MANVASSGALPRIPVIDLRYKKYVFSLTQEEKRLEKIYSVAQNHYGMSTLKIGDFLSHRWLKRNNSSYLDEIDLVHNIAPHEGAYMLNLSYEWSCTTCTNADPGGAGNRMLRTLDWPLDGLGSNLIVLRRKTPAGEYWDVTWPGFVGIVTAMAPGRFSAAINQPPMRLWTSSFWPDWVINRSKVWFQRALPPSHLLRKVFDSCRTYTEARQMLTKTPLAIPAFFSLSGINSNESCLIERTEKSAIVHEGPTTCANHWQNPVNKSWSRGLESNERLDAMDKTRNHPSLDFTWLKSPILNETTRVAVTTNAATDVLLVQGWELDGPATQPLVLIKRSSASY